MTAREPLPPLDTEPPAPPVPVPGAASPFGEFAPGAGLRDALGWVATIALALTLAFWVAALSGSQATSEEAALPALERAIVVLSEIDALLELHGEAIAEQVGAGEDVAVPGFPLDVRVPAADAEGPAELRAALLAASAARVRIEGSAAFQDPDSGPGETSRFSSAGLMQALIDGLTEERHDLWASFVRVPGAVSAALAVAVVLLGVGFGRFTRLGVVVAVAALLALVPAVTLRFGIDFAGDDDVVGDEARAIVQSLAGGGIRNALWLAAAGAAIAIPALVADRIFEGAERPASGADPARR